MNVRCILVLTLGMLSLAIPAQAQPFIGVAADSPALRYELGPEEIDRQHCGASVAISDDAMRVIVGVPDYTIGPVPVGSPLGQGRFRIFLRTGTTWASEFAATSGTSDEEMGTSVAMSADGSVVLVGAPGATGFSGRARVFRRTGVAWAADGLLVPTGVVSNDRAGMSVAMSADGTWAVVGVPYDDTARGTDAGHVAVFVRGAGGWTQDGTLVPTTGNSASRFGASVAISSVSPLVIVVGAPGDMLPSGAQGAAYVYQRVGSAWAEVGRLFDDAGGSSDALGTSVAIDAAGTRIVTGAPDAHVLGLGQDGKVLHFALVSSEWRRIETLSAPTVDEEFGRSVALSADGRRLLVGAPRFSTATATTGTSRLYLRRTDTFAQDASLRPTDAADGDELGGAVALTRDGTRAVVGMPLDNVTVTDEGTARVFRLTAMNGAACGVAADCPSGFCADGVCCSAACTRGAGTPCQACLSASTGVADGTCAPTRAGTMCAPGTGTCDPADFCDGIGAACPVTFASATTECRASTGVCDATETCTGTSGSCPADGPVPDGTGCADADLCNGTETCSAGSCAAGTTLDCDDGDVCTADACDALTGCAHATITGCCNADAECGDASVCNGAEVCVANVCTAGVTLDCDDGDLCTADACDAITGCASSAIDGCCNADLDCDDGDPCTEDLCLGGAGGACEHSPICDAGAVDAGALLDAGMPATDGGGRDASTVDGGEMGDAGGGTPPPAAGGCGCRTGGTSSSGGLGALVLLALALVRRRQRA